MASPIDTNVPMRALLAGETKGSFARLLANLNVKRNLTSVFANRYLSYFVLNYFSKLGVKVFSQLPVNFLLLAYNIFLYF